MNNNADLDFLRFLAERDYGMNLTDGLAILNKAKGLFTTAPATAAAYPSEGMMFQGLYFSPEADRAILAGQKIAAIKEVRNDNRLTSPWKQPNLWGYKYSGDTLSLKDSKDAVEARMRYMGI